MSRINRERLLSEPFKISANSETAIIPGQGEYLKRFEAYNEMRENGELCDVTFIVTGKTRVKKQILAHKLIVANSSPYCATVISANSAKMTVEIKIEGNIEHDVLNNVISYMYTGSLVIPLTKVENYYAAAHILQLGLIKEECIKLLTTNVLAYPATTLKRKPDKLDSLSIFGELWLKVFGRVFEAFVIFVDSDEFVKIPENHFKNIMELFLTHKPEVDVKMVIYALQTWMKPSLQNRSKVVDWMLELLKRNSMSSHVMKDIFTALKDNILELPTEDRPLLQMDVDNDGCSSESSSIMEINGSKSEVKKRPLPKSVVTPPAKKQAVTVTNEANKNALMVFIEGDATGTRALWAFNFEKDIFMSLIKMPTIPDVQSTLEEIVAVGDTLFVIGGYYQNLATTSDLVYSTDLSKEKSWKRLAKLNISRKEFATVAHKDFIYVLGGTNTKNSRGAISSVERFNVKEAGAKWNFVANMAEARVSCSAAILYDKIFVVGGKQQKGSKTVLNSVEVYDIENNVWTTISSMWVPRCEFGLTRCNNQLYAIGGQNDTGVLDSVEVYDPVTNKWSFTESMSTRRKYPGVFALNEKIYVFGGYNKASVRIASSERYCPRSCHWEEYVKPDALTSSFRTIALVNRANVFSQNP